MLVLPVPDPDPTETREHRFKKCPEWKAQQKILWVGVRLAVEYLGCRTGSSENRRDVTQLHLW